MPRDAQTAIHLKDYTPPAYLIDRVELVFRLDPARTRVTSRIAFRPNPQATGRDFFLHGEGLTLIRARIDGAEITPRLVEGGLEADVPDAPFTWEAEVEIAPEGNTALEGLYMSNGMFCTQCEAEGFRKITYYPDRPDVMAEFHVRIESDLPVLLSKATPRARVRAGPNGTIPGRNRPICSPWSPGICGRCPIGSPPGPAAWSI